MTSAASWFRAWLCCAALIVGAASIVNALDIMDELDRAFAPALIPPDDGGAAALPADAAVPTSPLSSARTALSGNIPSVRVRVSASRHTILSTQSTGRIEEFRVKDGDRFQKGDLLVRMDDALPKLQMQRAQAVYDRQAVVHRMVKELYDLGTKGEAELEVAEADLAQAETDRSLARHMLARTRVEAPFAGRVADVFAREMQYLPEGQPLLEILDDSTLELEFIVSSQWVSWFAPGYRFTVTVEETGRVYEAELQRIGGKVDPLSQSMKAYAVLLEPDASLMEGMSGAAHIAPPAEDGR